MLFSRSNNKAKGRKVLKESKEALLLLFGLCPWYLVFYGVKALGMEMEESEVVVKKKDMVFIG